MRISLSLLAIGLSALTTGCQTPLMRDGLFSKMTPSSDKESDTPKKSSFKNPKTDTRSESVAQNSSATPKQPSLDPRVTAEITKGNTAIDQKRYTEARMHFETVLKSEPNNAHAHHMLGRVSDQQSQFEESERHYLAALSAKPNDANLLCDIGYSYFLQARHAEAKDYLQRTLAQQPGHQMALMNLAAVCVDQGDNAQAMAYYQQIAPPQQADRMLAAELNRKLARRRNVATSSAQAAEAKTPRTLEELNRLMSIERERSQASREEIRRLEDELQGLQSRIAQRDYQAQSRLNEQAANTAGRMIGQGMQPDPSFARQAQYTQGSSQLQLGQPGSQPPAGQTSFEGTNQNLLQFGKGFCWFNPQTGEQMYGSAEDAQQAHNMGMNQPGRSNFAGATPQGQPWMQGQPANQFANAPQQGMGQFGSESMPSYNGNNGHLGSNVVVMQPWNPAQQGIPPSTPPANAYNSGAPAFGNDPQGQFANVPLREWTPQGVPLLPNQHEMQQAQFQQSPQAGRHPQDPSADNAKRAMVLGMGAGSAFQLPGSTNMEAQRPTYTPQGNMYQQPGRGPADGTMFVPQPLPQSSPNQQQYQYQGVPSVNQGLPQPNSVLPGNAGNSAGGPLFDTNRFQPMPAYGSNGVPNAMNRNSAPPAPAQFQPSPNDWQGIPAVGQPAAPAGQYRQ